MRKVEDFASCAWSSWKDALRSEKEGASLRIPLRPIAQVISNQKKNIPNPQKSFQKPGLSKITMLFGFLPCETDLLGNSGKVIIH